MVRLCIIILKPILSEDMTGRIGCCDLAVGNRVNDSGLDSHSRPALILVDFDTST